MEQGATYVYFGIGYAGMSIFITAFPIGERFRFWGQDEIEKRIRAAQ